MQNMEIPENIRMDISEGIARMPREKIRRLQDMGFIDDRVDPKKVYFKLDDDERAWLLFRIILFSKLEKLIEREWRKWHNSHIIKKRKIVRGNGGEELKWETIPEKEHYRKSNNGGDRTNKLRRNLRPGEEWFKVKDGKITDEKADTSPPPTDIEDGWSELYEDVLDTVDRSLQVVQSEFFSKATSPGGRDRTRQIIERMSSSMRSLDEPGGESDAQRR